MICRDQSIVDNCYEICGNIYGGAVFSPSICLKVSFTNKLVTNLRSERKSQSIWHRNTNRPEPTVFENRVSNARAPSTRDHHRAKFTHFRINIISPNPSTHALCVVVWVLRASVWHVPFSCSWRLDGESKSEMLLRMGGYKQPDSSSSTRRLYIMTVVIRRHVCRGIHHPITQHTYIYFRTPTCDPSVPLCTHRSLVQTHIVLIETRTPLVDIRTLLRTT